jgi:tetratricopeptide (TPR) repeat protein
MRFSGFAQPGYWALGILPLVLGASARISGGQKAESTHVERFAAPAEKLRLAEREAEARVRANPTDVQALLDRGLARLPLAEVDAAIADFRRAAALAPERAEPETDLAYGLWMQGHLEEALGAARAALALDPHDASAHRYAGRLLLLLGGDRSSALAHLEEAARMNPQETDAHFDLVMAYRATGDAANAWAQLRLLQTEFPADDPRVLYVEGLLASDQGRLPVAIDSLRRALTGDPHLGEAREELGIALAKASRWSEAVDVLRPAARDNPKSFRLAYAYALALMNTNYLAEAEDAVQRALGLNSGSTEAHALLEQVRARLASAGEKQP